MDNGQLTVDNEENCQLSTVNCPLRRTPRILFLADRNILADQAYNAFSAFPEDALARIEPGAIRKKDKVPKNASLFFTIFQTFMASGASGDLTGAGQAEFGSIAAESAEPYFGEYPPDFFDFIIIDECHRGGANDESNWRGILDYFAPAVRLPKAASPAESESKTRGRQRAGDSAHDGDQLLAPGRYADVGAAVHGNAVRQVA